ncbi:MAG TPA: UDP-galactopyranose mutase [candidate division Zixibacteria bacterium]|nr:UDP-galactopyranose mutase [candidate division Zixibacteria bacterium]
MKVDFLIAGAGFAGCTLAERIATQFDKKVLLVETRNHIGGNTYDYYNEDGLLIQKYGPHIFHSNLRDVWDYLCRFTEWNGYVHRVIAVVRGKEVSLPINLDTMERLYERKFTSEELEKYFEQHRVKLDRIRNSRDVVVSQVGEELYDLFFKNYTKKQWGIYPDELDPEVTKRLPVRFNRDTRYFTDRYQGIPKHGFTRMFERMIDNKNIHLLLKTDYREIIDSVDYNKLIYTGPIDYYFDYMFGELPYRSLDFKFETLDMEKYQNAGVVNYPNDYNYTRITEFKHFYFQQHHKTTICYEYPMAEGDPYYPIPKPECREIYQKYKKEADKLRSVYFIGRLAQYKYLNMDQVVAGALKLFEELI